MFCVSPIQTPLAAITPYVSIVNPFFTTNVFAVAKVRYLFSIFLIKSVIINCCSFMAWVITGISFSY